ncbi:Bro-N domain-containing protein [bacterium]|nr:Bro-N domain-containing protein [bacterium]
MQTKTQIFDNSKIRSVWDRENEKWYFAIVDVVAILTENTDIMRARKYWNKLKQRLKEEGNETVTNCHQLKFLAADGKMRLTDVGDVEQILRLIQSIPSKKAEPFKLWLSKVGSVIIDEASDPELAIERAIRTYRNLGYSESWINQRLKSIEVRKGLTDEWERSGVKQGREYAILTDLMYRTWAGMSAKEYKEFKGLKKESLRDNMTNVELILNMLAEVSATEISKNENPENLEQSAEVAVSGAEVARDARKSLEKRGAKTISSKNAKEIADQQNLLEEDKD